MYKTIRGIYKKGQIIPKEPIDFSQDEIEIFITFLHEEKIDEETISSADDLLYTMGDRALEGTLTDASEKHDKYLYAKEQK
ncbi:MAG TPA: hypothetical protein DCK87_01385 [Desulfotomaculum sp.]|nr:hypothetical protein [Desulfotomaculum sp.]